MVKFHLISVDQRVEAGHEFSQYLLRDLVWQVRDRLPAFTQSSLNFRAVVDLCKLSDGEALLRNNVLLLDFLELVEAVDSESLSKAN